MDRAANTESNVTPMEAVPGRAPKLDREAIEHIVRSGRRLPSPAC